VTGLIGDEKFDGVFSRVVTTDEYAVFTCTNVFYPDNFKILQNSVFSLSCNTLCPENKRPKSFWNILYKTRMIPMKLCT